MFPGPDVGPCWLSILNVTMCTYLFFIEVELIYNAVFISGVQNSDSVISLILFRFSSLIGYYKILSGVPCAIQQLLISYLFYTC